ncbi:MAG TPA: response regulator [Allosphingosinicella sp.]|jgi:CheY-like chemotaxis protein
MSKLGKVALIVDDEVFARLFAAQILLDQGFIVLEAADAEEGLDVLERNDDVALLFTDISMPGEMDGIGLVSKVREDRPDVALLVTSGRVEPSAGDIPGGGRFLAKPYTAQSLMEAIRELESGGGDT